MKERIVQSISGGMDSTALLLHHLARDRDVHLISFDYGQKHRLELDRLDDNLDYLSEQESVKDKISHRRIAIPLGQIVHSALTTPEEGVPRGFYEEPNMKQTVVPNRNAIFSAFVFAHALSVKRDDPEAEVSVSLGVHSGDHAIYPDCREEFFKVLHEAFAVGNWDGDQIRFSIPYIDGDKESILYGALEDCDTLGLDFDQVFANTNTSYAPTEEGLADGGTGSDVERILAFHAIGRKDPVPYVGGWEKALKDALDAEKKFQSSN